jgi:crotonobetainyl-CoA:carnitine CoA-transferase CaiB-like acyl-CoA transferase
MENGILSGLRVVDCGTYVAGPAAATVMADFGAEVFKIERPQGGDLFRLFHGLPGQAVSDVDYNWMLVGRSKKSVALDLGNSEGRDALIALVKSADVFVTNYQPQILAKFRLTWKDLSPLNSRLIYAHLTGYGDAGEDADLPAFDALAYWARSGLMTSVIGADGTPGSPRPAMGDHPTSSALFGAIMLGLFQRERTGCGAKVGTSLMAAGAWANACDLQAQLVGAVFPQRRPGATPPNPLAAAYMSADGKVFMLAQLDPDHEFPRLCEALGHPDLATNEMFANTPARGQFAAELHAILSGEFESRNLSELRGLFRRFDVKWSPLPTREDVVTDPQMRACGAFVNHEYPGRGSIETIDSPVFVFGSTKRRPIAGAEIGAHTREVLREIGYTDDKIDSMIRGGVVAEPK